MMIAFVLLCIFGFALKFSSVYLTSHNAQLKVCNWSQFFTLETLEKIQSIHASRLRKTFALLAVSKVRYKYNSSFFELLLLLSGDLSLNSAPFQNHQSIDNNKRDVSKTSGVNFIHINVNSLLP